MNKLLLFSLTEDEIDSGCSVENILKYFRIDLPITYGNVVWVDKTREIYYNWDSLTLQGLMTDGGFLFSYELPLNRQEELKDYFPNDVYGSIKEFSELFYGYEYNGSQFGFYRNLIGKLEDYKFSDIYLFNTKNNLTSFLEVKKNISLSEVLLKNITSTFDLNAGWIDQTNRKKTKEWYNNLKDSNVLYLIEYH